MQILACSPPFSILPLQFRCFTEYAQSILEALPPIHLDHDVGIILDFGGVSGTDGWGRENTPGETGREGPIDVQDSDFRGQVWNHWAAIREDAEGVCLLCQANVDLSVSPARV